MQSSADQQTGLSMKRLQSFLGRWTELRNGSTPAERLDGFLRQARPLLRPEFEAEELRPEFKPEEVAPPQLSAEHLQRVLTIISEPLVAARVRGDALDIWEVAGLGRDEVRTARVLTWLLDPHGSHGAGDAYLQALWAEIRGEQILNFALLAPQRTARENYPLGDQENRVDVEVVGGNFLLFIEVKIDAVEGINQINRYCTLAAKKAASLRREHWAVLYLSQRAPEQNIDRCLHLRWRTIAQAIKSAAKNLHTDDFSTRVALGFAKHVERLH